MAPNVTDDGAGADINKSPPDGNVAELYDWLWERVADERDVVVDDMQEDHFARLEAEDDARDDLPGSAEYRDGQQDDRQTMICHKSTSVNYIKGWSTCACAWRVH